MVEPDCATREEVRSLLGGLDCVVRCYPSAEEFLRAFRPHQVGCLITELKLPGMSGLELLAHLGNSGLKFPSVIFTGEGSVRDAVKAIHEGAISVVGKPLRKRALIDEVRRILT